MNDLLYMLDIYPFKRAIDFIGGPLDGVNLVNPLLDYIIRAAGYPDNAYVLFEGKYYWSKFCA